MLTALGEHGKAKRNAEVAEADTEDAEKAAEM
jgi:hypothetical protein